MDVLRASVASDCAAGMVVCLKWDWHPVRAPTSNPTIIDMTQSGMSQNSDIHPPTPPPHTHACTHTPSLLQFTPIKCPWLRSQRGPSALARYAALLDVGAVSTDNRWREGRRDTVDNRNHSSAGNNEACVPHQPDMPSISSNKIKWKKICGRGGKKKQSIKPSNDKYGIGV